MRLFRVSLQGLSPASHCLVSDIQNSGARIHELPQSWSLKNQYYLMDNAAKFL